MVDFNEAAGVQEVRGNTQPTERVVQDNSVANLLQGASAFIPTQAAQAAKQKANSENQSNKFMADFSRKQIAIADALEQDTGMTSEEAQSRWRSNLSAALANAPHMSGDILKTQKSIEGIEVVSETVLKGTEAERTEEKLRASAGEAGFIKPWMSDAQREQATRDYTTQEYIKTQMEYDAKRMAAEQADVNLSKSQIELNNAKNKKSAQDNIKSLGVTQTQKSFSDIADIVRRFENGEYANPEDAIFEAKDQLSVVTAVINQTGMGAGNEYISAVAQPIIDAYANLEERLTGKLTADMYANMNKTVQSKAEAIVLTDPSMLQLIATNKLLGHQPILTKETSTRVMNFYEKNSIEQNPNPSKKPASPFSATPEENEDSNTYFGRVKSMLNQTDNGGIKDPETQQEVIGHLSQVVKSVSTYGSSVDSPEEFKSVMSFLGSSEVGLFAEQLGGMPMAAEGRQIIMEQYEKVVVPLIQEEYLNAQSAGIRNNENISGDITPTFNGAGVFFSTESDDPMVRSKAVSLNRKVSPVLNNLIRVSSHYAGNTNYESTFDQHYQGLFLEEQQDPERDTMNMMNRAQAKAGALQSKLKADEGQVLKTYKDSEGNLTAGIGHLLSPEEQEKYPLGADVPQAVVDKWFVEDSEGAKLSSEKIIKDFGLEGLDDTKKGVISEMVFQMGDEGTRAFKKMLAALKAKDFDEASRQIMNSKWASQTPARAARAAARIAEV